MLWALFTGLPHTPPQPPDGPQAVVGGEPADPADWPGVAALHAYGFRCSGVLIHPEWALTAGHCGPDLLTLHLGGSQVDDPVAEVVPVQEVILYPDYTQHFDVALVHLARPASIAPAAPVRDCLVDQLVPGLTLVVTGYGATDEEGREPAGRLHAAEVALTDPGCADRTAGCREAIQPDGELVAGGAGRDSCTGDSGGPLWLLAEEGPYLLGITSRAALPSPTACGSGGVYSRVDALLPWIEAVIGETLPGPDCSGANRPPASGALHLAWRGGQPLYLQLSAPDPDPQQRVSWSLDLAPQVGSAQVSPEGLLRYQAPPGLVGTDHLVARVTDDGQPPTTATWQVELRLTEEGDELGAGCASAPGWAPGWAGLLLLLVGHRRRARCSSR